MNSESFDSRYTIVADRLRSAHRVLALTHVSPDGDALGSLCFFSLLMEKLGKECVLYTAGPLPASLEFLPNFERIIIDKTQIDFSSFDTFVTLDCATPERSNAAAEIFARSKEQIFIEIDHHPSSRVLADAELRIIESASTTQVLFELAKVIGVQVSPRMAKSLMTGIITDTASFIHPSASKQTISAAADMISRGASISRLHDQTSRTKTMLGLKLWGKALSRLTRNEKFNIVYTIITDADVVESGNDEDAVEGIAGFLASIEDASAILVLRETKGEIKGSLRTTKDAIDVNRLARGLGGGGHRRASGFRFPGHLVCENGQWQVEYK